MGDVARCFKFELQRWISARDKRRRTHLERAARSTSGRSHCFCKRGGWLDGGWYGAHRFVRDQRRRPDVASHRYPKWWRPVDEGVSIRFAKLRGSTARELAGV